MYKKQFTRGEKVWWTSLHNLFDNPKPMRVMYGIIRTTSGRFLEVQVYDSFLRPGEILLFPRHLINKFHPDGLSKLNEAIKVINIGRLQYNQHFFRSRKYKKTAKSSWRVGYEQYKRLCKQYGVPVSPKRTMSDMSEEW